MFPKSNFQSFWKREKVFFVPQRGFIVLFQLLVCVIVVEDYDSGYLSGIGRIAVVQGRQMVSIFGII